MKIENKNALSLLNNFPVNLTATLLTLRTMRIHLRHTTSNVTFVKKIFRDTNELRNHDCNHKMEFFQCLMCFLVFRSICSFENHHLSHSKENNCSVCGNFFPLKSSLINHAQVHSSDRMHCPKCRRTFKHQQNHLEHIVWAHRDRKEYPCTVCKKMFQNPTNMHSHRLRVHGPIADIVPGHPGKCNK